MKYLLGTLARPIVSPKDPAMSVVLIESIFRIMVRRRNNDRYTRAAVRSMLTDLRLHAGPAESQIQ